MEKSTIRRGRICQLWTLIAAFCMLLSLIFLVLVEIGNTNSSLASIYIFKVDTSDLITDAAESSQTLKEVAEAIVPDYYTVGLWNYCTYKNTTSCEATQALYWFNPVEIIYEKTGQTLLDSSSPLLTVVRIASNLMFAFFLAGTCLAAISIPAILLSTCAKWLSVLTTILGYVTAIIVTLASVIATIMFVYMAKYIGSIDDLNINTELGTKMFAFMWTATALSILACIVQNVSCCLWNKRRRRYSPIGVAE